MNETDKNITTTKDILSCCWKTNKNAHILSLQQEIGTITTLVENNVIQLVKTETEEEAEEEAEMENDKNYAYVKLSKSKLEFVSHRQKKTNPGAYIRFKIQETNQKECAKCGPTFGELFNCEIKLYKQKKTNVVLSTELWCEVCARCESKTSCPQNRKEKNSQQKYTFWKKTKSEGGNIFCSEECVKNNWSICTQCNCTVSHDQYTNYCGNHYNCNV